VACPSLSLPPLELEIAESRVGADRIAATIGVLLTSVEELPAAVVTAELRHYVTVERAAAELLVVLRVAARPMLLTLRLVLLFPLPLCGSVVALVQAEQAGNDAGGGDAEPSSCPGIEP
jgi:hypothetical protein